MKIAMFSAKEFERPFFEAANKSRHQLLFFPDQLSLETTELATSADSVCAFVCDRLDAAVLHRLQKLGVSLIALRSAGSNNLDVQTAAKLGLTCVYVPSYSPYAVAEFAVGLLLSLNRKIHLAFNRVQSHSFHLDGFVGFDLNGQTVGVIGTGRIGKVFCRIMRGFGCRVIAYDQTPDPAWADELQVDYVPLAILLKISDVISIHVPLTNETKNLINVATLNQMKSNALLINTARGGIVDTTALLNALDANTIAGAALDVYENEGPVFFRPRPEAGLTDQLLIQLIANPKVVLTGHQGFLTRDALLNIANTTIESCSRFEDGASLESVRVFGT